MIKPVKLSQEFQEFKFLTYYKENRAKLYIYRCLALHHIQSGNSYDQVSELILYSRKTIMQWVRRFEEGGLDSLLSIKAGRGRKARVSSDLSEEFSEAVISLQKNRNGGRIIGQDIVNLVQEKYDVQYSVSGIYKVLSRMGVSWVSGRSIHPKSNLAAQEAFKKTLNKLKQTFKRLVLATLRSYRPQNKSVYQFLCVESEFRG